MPQQLETTLEADDGIIRTGLLATSPDAVWWGGALTLVLTAVGFLRLGHRIPDPLLQTVNR